MFAFTYAAAILAIVYTVVAAAFCVWRRERQIDRALAAYLGTAAVWIAANVIADVSYTPQMLILSSGIAFIAGGLNILCCLLLIDTLIDGKFPSWHRVLIYALLTTGVTPFGFGPYGIAGTIFPPGEPAQIIPGILYTVGVFSLPLYLLYGITRLIRSLKRVTDYAKRMQILYVLAGVLLTLFGQALFDIILPLLGELRFFELGPISSVFFAGGTAYAVLRHRLVDIRFVIQRGLIYTGLFALLIATYSTLLMILSEVVGATAHANTLISAGITLVLGAFTVPYIERFFRRVTDPFFFKDKYEYAGALHELSRLLYTHADLADLVHESEITLAHLLRAEDVRILLTKVDEETPLPDDRMRLEIPLTQGDGLIGTIRAGYKRSGEPYTQEDEQLLRTFAYQAATAFSRAHLFDATLKHASHLEERVKERTADLEALQEEQRRMMVDLTHNLQTPLAVLQAGLDRAKQTGTFGNEHEGLQHSITALSQFIYDLLSLASLDRTLAAEPMERFSLSCVVQDIVEELRVITAGSDVEIQSDVEEGIEFVGNEKRVREALRNLAHNAHKYLHTERPKRISLHLAHTDDAIVLSVIDTGIGIPLDDQKHIFERFYRAQGNTTTQGTGLGLAIVKRIVENHRGTITVESTAEEGSRFSIRLPL